MNLKDVDEKDLQILKLLSENGRLSHAQLGRMLSLTRAAVRERVNRLIKIGIIDKFTIIINPLRAGSDISVYFEITTEWSKADYVATRLLEREEITNIYQMSSFSHLHVHALFENQLHLNRFIEILKGIDGITNVKSDFLIKRFKERGSVLI